MMANQAEQILLAENVELKRALTIEVALEQVRLVALAMKEPADMLDICQVISVQLEQLGIREIRNVQTAIIDTAKATYLNFEYYRRHNKALITEVDYSHPQTAEFVRQMLSGPDGYFTTSLAGAELKEWYEYQKSTPQFVDSYLEDASSLNYYWFSVGNIALGLSTYLPLNPGEGPVVRRFRNVFELAYRRYADVELALAQAREAKIETALERVRARALAMQQPEELIEVAEVLRYEMGLLGIEELETCSIYINDEKAEKAECWYALKDVTTNGKKLVSDHFSLNLNDTWVGRQMLEFYRSTATQISIVMQGANRVEWIRYCEKRSSPIQGYYEGVIPDRTYHLYKFTFGAIGAAAVAEISAESWGLLKRAASVFSLAYARFKDLSQAHIDLQRLKEEKQRAEHALTELKATQKQLIQAEKMASLGELTAGIAHEIQNPLNFVNNFSEINTDLLNELQHEADKGNLGEVKSLAQDIKLNEEKINHHGKRADDIVKGMLQHSRTSTGIKEPTDINTLADEYLRLSYHGLRARDKSFNANMFKNFDETMLPIKIIPQEIGRVILNLLNNAFYAAAGVSHSDHKPTVWLTTKNCADHLELSIRDNGAGIPEKIRDKIFQPFFTTKPTGQGTGLGLSLSYDIVRAHDGEIKVESKEGEGTTFVILLPFSDI